MARKGRFLDNNVVSLSALDMFANALGTLAFMLLLFSINAIEATRPPKLQILTSRLPACHPGLDYLGVVSVAGGVPPYRFNLTSGSLPPGLLLDAQRGEIAGTTSALNAVPFSFEVQVGDSRKSLANTRLEIRVQGGQRPARVEAQSPVITAREDPSAESAAHVLTFKLPLAIAGENYELQLAGVGRFPFRWSARDLPAGVTLTDDGILRGKPVSPGSANFTVSFQDARNRPAPEETLSLEVRPRSLSALGRLRRRGLYAWIGYVLILLFEAAYLFLIRMRDARSIAVLLRLHDVNLIQKPDGTAALNGPRAGMEAVQRGLAAMHKAAIRYKTSSYLAVGVLLIVYTGYLISQ
jgi:hypothetical protein